MRDYMYIDVQNAGDIKEAHTVMNDSSKSVNQEMPN